MTQKDKQLLLQDLCARLPYEPWVWFKENWETNPNFKGCQAQLRLYHLEYIVKDSDITLKPCLRPISSMTEEEKEDFYRNVLDMDIEDIRYENDGKLPLPYNQKDKFIWFENIYLDDAFAVIDWFNAHHFDFRNLIEKGLAIEVTKDNNPYKNLKV